MQDRLLNAYLAGTVEEVVYKAKSAELKAEAARADETLAQLGRGGPGPRRNGDGALRLDAKRGGNLARFIQSRSARGTRRGLFEPHIERRKPRRHKEKAVRRFRRTAVFEE